MNGGPAVKEISRARMIHQMQNATDRPHAPPPAFVPATQPEHAAMCKQRRHSHYAENGHARASDRGMHAADQPSANKPSSPHHHHLLRRNSTPILPGRLPASHPLINNHKPLHETLVTETASLVFMEPRQPYIMPHDPPFCAHVVAPSPTAPSYSPTTAATAAPLPLAGPLGWFRRRVSTILENDISAALLTAGAPPPRTQSTDTLRPESPSAPRKASRSLICQCPNSIQRESLTTNDWRRHHSLAPYFGGGGRSGTFSDRRLSSTDSVSFSSDEGDIHHNNNAPRLSISISEVFDSNSFSTVCSSRSGVSPPSPSHTRNAPMPVPAFFSYYSDGMITTVSSNIHIPDQSRSHFSRYLYLTAVACRTFRRRQVKKGIVSKNAILIGADPPSAPHAPPLCPWYTTCLNHYGYIPHLFVLPVAFALDLLLLAFTCGQGCHCTPRSPKSDEGHDHVPTQSHCPMQPQLQSQQEQRQHLTAPHPRVLRDVPSTHPPGCSYFF